MSGALLAVLAEGVLRMVLFLAAEQISRLWGFNEDLQKLAGKLQMIQALLHDAESKRISNTVVQLWLKKLQAVAFDAEDFLDEFAYEIFQQKMKIAQRKREKVRTFFSYPNPLASRLYFAHKIKDIRVLIEEVYKESNEIGLRAVEIRNTAPEIKDTRLTDPFFDDSDIVGRTEDTSKVAEMLITSDSENDLSVVGIVGMAGQGKTTLAKLAYKNNRVVNHFDRRIWICVSDDFAVEKLLNEMVQSLTQVKSEMTNREALVKKLQGYLNDKRYLIVLDDVWNEDGEKWECMRNCLLEIGGSKGSKIMATTRSDGVISTMQTSFIHRLGVLSPEESWILFKKIAFADGGAQDKSGLVAIGRRILGRCGGVPIAVKALGGLMYSQKDENVWLEMQNSLLRLSNNLEGVLSTLRLSYDNLPSSSLKECFSYCSIFQKDTIIEKEKLIQLWMAQGLLNPSTHSRLEMETIGNNYFNILLHNSLLQDAKKDDYNRIVACKMHDLVHDLAVDTSKNYCLTLDSEEVIGDVKPLHLSLFTNVCKLLRMSNEIFQRLRTLYLVGNIPGEMLMSFIRLRVLILDDFAIEELPKSIGKLKHLRYLDVSRTSIKRLPNSITKLYYLQTLRLKDLEEMPTNFKNLINLRHFCLEDTEENQLKCNFAGIGHLGHLQTLPFLVIDPSFQCQIEELGGLKNLKGDLKIYGLDNVRSYKEAKKADLLSKSNIQRLELHWGFLGDISEESNDEEEILNFLESISEEFNDEEVLDALMPHSNLKGLLIENYKGSTFPPWMMMQSESSLVLNNVVAISLQNCFRCYKIPALGHLPHLETLEICNMPNVKIIDSEFYGFTSMKDSNGGAVTVFPALTEFSLTEMPNLVEWQGAKDPSASLIKVFPNLQQLNVEMCPRLTCLPGMNGLTDLQRLKIFGCSNLTCLPEDLGSLVSLQLLRISFCRSLVSIPNLQRLHSLRQLDISDCWKLIALPNGLEVCTSLSSLEINFCPNLQYESLKCLAGLNLRWLRIGGFSYKLDCFPWPSTSYGASTLAASSQNVNPKSHFVSLVYLSLHGWPGLVSMPEQLQNLCALRTLSISNFNGLEALPEWLGNLASLEKLLLFSCQNLVSLPSAEAMQCLTNFRKLFICKCPLLAERCTDTSHPEYAKIAHITQVEIKQ